MEYGDPGRILSLISKERDRLASSTAAASSVSPDAAPDALPATAPVAPSDAAPVAPSDAAPVAPSDAPTQAPIDAVQQAPIDAVQQAPIDALPEITVIEDDCDVEVDVVDLIEHQTSELTSILVARLDDLARSIERLASTVALSNARIHERLDYISAITQEFVDADSSDDDNTDAASESGADIEVIIQPQAMENEFDAAEHNSAEDEPEVQEEAEEQDAAVAIAAEQTVSLEIGGEVYAGSIAAVSETLASVPMQTLRDAHAISIGGATPRRKVQLVDALIQAAIAGESPADSV